MKPKNLHFDEHEVLHKISHYLPAQNPLKDFVHHNTLHAFQHKNFFEALHESAEVFGYKTYLSIKEFRDKFYQGQINKQIFSQVIQLRKGTEAFEQWNKKLLNVSFDESLNPRIGRLRALWKNKYEFNLEKQTHGVFFRILCSYLDQGIAIWSFPVHKQGFLASIKELEKNGLTTIFRTPRAKKLLNNNATITELLQILVGDEQYFENYLFDQQFAHPGWSGMVTTIENNPTSLLDSRKITLTEAIIFELLLEIDALDLKFDKEWKPLHSVIKDKPKDLFEKLTYSDYFETLALWQEILEWSLYNKVLLGLSKVVDSAQEKKETTPEFQGLFCMDDRECSLRRHLEFVQPKAQTFGVAAFFNFEFFYQPINGKFFTKLCPAPLTPKYLIKELPRKSRSAKDLHYNKLSHYLFFGWIISQTLGFASAVKLFFNIFKPTLTPATSSSFKHLHPKSKLMIENYDADNVVDGLQVGFTIPEMASRVVGLLKSIGLVENFAPIVYVVGHGATSVNNTHFAGYDCGACSGRPSSVNAKVFCYAANHPEVRDLLKKEGIQIPKTTQFLPGLHDTTRDEITFYDEEILNEVNTIKHEQNLEMFKQSLIRNAKERSLKFDTIDSSKSLKKVHQLIKNRSVSLFEPRPELNHATNAMCIVGRRDLSKNLFLDRRSFLNSFDYRVDPTGDYLAGILGAVAPVGGGINLEYYFSRVDNQKLGAGSKLPHNVMGLIGVANGVDGDLRPGLPSQMIEIHDPLRILIVVEHLPSVVKYAITKNPATYEWFYNGWVNLVVLNPENNQLYRFEKGSFFHYKPIEEPLNSISETLDINTVTNQTDTVCLIKEER